MPSKSKAKPAKAPKAASEPAATEPVEAPPAQPEPDATAPDATAPDATGPDAGEAEEFANRAARRAHGKGKAQPVDKSRVAFPGRGTKVQGPRQWSNRRSGG